MDKLEGKIVNVPVRVEESGELYAEQADYEDYEDIEVAVELFCDHPEVEGSFEIVAPRWKVLDILKSLETSMVVKGKPASNSTRAPIYQENPDETITEVFTDIKKKATGEALNPLQEVLVNVVDSFFRIIK